jgi:hypothetical protein
MPSCVPVHLTIAFFGRMGTRLFLSRPCSDLCLFRRRRWSCRGGSLLARRALRVVEGKDRHDGSVEGPSSGLGGLACGSIDGRHNYGRSYRKREIAVIENGETSAVEMEKAGGGGSTSREEEAEGRKEVVRWNQKARTLGGVRRTLDLCDAQPGPLFATTGSAKSGN